MIKKLKWYGKNGIDMTWKLPQADDFCDYRQFILDNINFVKVVKYFKLRPDECSTGKYTHRMICPFRFHKNGHERTGSFRFNNKKKTFTCFGCNEGGDILKFLQLYRGGSEQYNLQRLAIMANLIKDGEIQLPENYVEPEEEVLKENNHKVLFDAGILIRKYLLDVKHTHLYVKECEWADQMLIKIDKYFAMIDEENINDANKIYSNLSTSLKKRKSKIKGL